MNHTETAAAVAAIVAKAAPPNQRLGAISKRNGDGTFQVTADGASVAWPQVWNATGRTDLLAGQRVRVAQRDGRLSIIGVER